MNEPTPQEVTVYGARWCRDCTRAKAFLTEHDVPFQWIDIDDNPDGAAYVRRIQNGGHTIPTIAFPDGGEHLIEPSNAELARRLGLAPGQSST